MSVPYVVQHGRRKGSIVKMTPAELNDKPNPPVDLRRVFVLPMSEWRRIQDSVKGVNREHERLIAVAKERAALHQRSKAVVKNWTNTTAGQRQKRLEAKKIRDETEEERRKEIDIEEAKFQEQKRKEIIERAKTQQCYQIDRTRKFNSALLLTEVLREREAQINLKKRKEKNCKDIDKEILDMVTYKEALALQQDQLKALEKKQNSLAVVESLKQQIKEHEQAKEDEKKEKKTEKEKVKRLHELYAEAQIAQELKKKEEKRNLIKANQEHLALKKILQEAEAEKQKLEEERQMLFLKNKRQWQKLQKEKEAEQFREFQRHREAIGEKQKAYCQEKTLNEDELISRAAAEAQAKQDKQQHEKDEKRAAMFKSIAEHRKALKKELNDKIQEEKQKAVEMLNAKKASDTIFLQKQQLKAQKIKDAFKSLQDAHIHQMAERQAQEERLKKQEQEFDARNEELAAEDENHFKNYANHVIQKASEAQTDTSLLHSAKNESIGKRPAHMFGTCRPRYVVPKQSTFQIPSYACTNTQVIKELIETTDIKESKKRLGFTW